MKAVLAEIRSAGEYGYDSDNGALFDSAVSANLIKIADSLREGYKAVTGAEDYVI
jgi:hypothetical protein